MATIQLQGNWEEKAASVRSVRDNSLAQVVPALEGLPDELPLNSQSIPRSVLSTSEIEITEGYSVTELLTKLRSRELSSEEVTRAFLRRAAVAQVAVGLTLLAFNPQNP